MAVGTRFLRSAAIAAPLAATVELLASPDWYGTAPVSPAAYAYNGKTYFTGISGDGGAKVAAYTHASQAVSSPFTLRALGADVHNAPSIIVRDSDKRLVSAYSAHDGANIYVRISTNPEDATAWGTEQVIGSGDYTYITLVQLRSVTNQPIIMFYRNYAGLGRLAYRVSTDGGATWGSEVLLQTVSSGSDASYWRITTDWDTRVDVAITDHDRSVAATSLYHMYYNGTAATWHQSDGTTIVASRPFAVTNATLVKNSADGNVAPEDVAYDASGTPVIVYQVYISATPTNSVRQARWNGSAWTHATIADTNGLATASNFRFEAGAAIYWGDPDHVVVGRKVSGHFEMFVYSSPDSGSTWAGAQLTTTVTGDCLMVQPVVNGSAAMRVIWHAGTLTSSSVFALNSIGYRR